MNSLHIFPYMNLHANHNWQWHSAIGEQLHDWIVIYWKSFEQNWKWYINSNQIWIYRNFSIQQLMLRTFKVRSTVQFNMDSNTCSASDVIIWIVFPFGPITIDYIIIQTSRILANDHCHTRHPPLPSDYFSCSLNFSVQSVSVHHFARQQLTNKIKRYNNHNI